MKGESGVSVVTYALQMDPNASPFKFSMVAYSCVAVLVGMAAYSEAGLIVVLGIAIALFLSWSVVTGLAGDDWITKFHQGFNRYTCPT